MRGRAHRAWLLLPAGLSLLAGIDAGLLLLEVPAPVGAAHLPDVHGPLMVLGFLGTLIALERAVALRSALGYAAPALLGLGGLALVVGLPRTIGQVLLLDGTVALVAVLVALWRRRRDDPVTVEVLGASLAVLAALLWVRVDAAVVVPLLAGFVVLTIAAERVELARIHLPASAERVLVAVAALVASAAMAAVLFPDAGSRAFGLSLLVLVVWLAPRDVARRTVRGTGQPRFCAAAMLAGYAWLAVAGVAWAASGVTTTPAAHDVVVHTIFLGFVMSMVLAHAPVILPAVLRRPVPYRPLLWVPLVVLHAALLVRVAGDLAGRPVLVAVGGYGTAAALLLLPLAAVLTATLRAPAPRHPGPPLPARSCGPDRPNQEPPVNPPTPQASRRTWPLRDRPGLVWLGLAAALTLVHRWVPGSDWLLVHLVLLGALTHSAMVWSTHFTQALLKTPAEIDDRTQQNRRIALLIAGVTAVLVGVPTGVWPLTAAGATAVSVAVLWHGIQLWRRLRRALPGRFRVTVRYYLAAAACVPVGATLGAWLARGLDDERHGQVLVAHSMVMVLGWIGLTVTGTLVTLWPTMLRTRMDARAESLARQALPVLVTAIAVIATGAALGSRPAALAGLVGYAAGLVWWGRALVGPARQAPPKVFATWSVSAALGWAVVALALVGWRLATSPSWATLADGYGIVAAVVVVGFAAQLLFGALSHLIPSVLGGGPSVVRAASAWLDRGALWRVTVVNLGLLVCLLPAPSAVRVAVSVLVLGALVAFLPLLLRSIKAAVAARRALLTSVADATERGVRPTPPTPAEAPRTRSGAQLLTAVASLALVVTLGIAADPAAAGLTEATTAASASTAGVVAARAGVRPTGHTTRVTVEAHDMSYSPASLSVPYGDRLVIDLVNRDDGSPHDLTFGDGIQTGRVMPGRSATLDVGVVAASTQGWCRIVGHRQMGMVLDIVVTGAPMGPANEVNPADAAAAAPAGDPPVNLSGTPAAGFTAVPAALPPLDRARTHAVTLTIEEVELEVAPGVRQKRWTFNGAVPGPTLHGRVGDTFVVTLVNHGSMGHSIDFHAGAVAPDAVMRTIAPGGSLTYRFTADRAGVWMYHCSTMPMSAHIAAGMNGAVVIEPKGLPTVDTSYVLVQAEVYLDGDGRSSVREVDAPAAAANTPNAVVFNGVATQYVARPLTARVGDRVRFWVLAAGPNRGSSFHVVGAQFDTVWKEGAYLLRAGVDPFGDTGGGSQVLDLAAAQGGFVELTPQQAGHYPFVTHAMADAERGARGILLVTR